MIWELAALVSILLAAGLTYATIWSRRKTWMRAAAVTAFLALLPVSVGVGMFAMSFPAPQIMMKMLPGGKYHVLHVKMRYGEAIFLLMDVGEATPRFFSLPWNDEVAKRLQGMLDKQRVGEGGRIYLKHRYEKSLDNNPPQFLQPPQPKMLPDKPQQEAPEQYEREA